MHNSFFIFDRGKTVKRFFVLFFVSCGIVLSSTAKGMMVEEPDQEADKAARSAYARINKNWKYPKNDKTPVSSTLSWEEISVVTNAGPTSMVCWSPEKQPHLREALEEIFNAKDLIMDCSNAARLVRLYMICQMLGEEKTLELTDSVRTQHPESQFNFMNALSWSFLDRVESVEERGIYCFPFVNIEKYPEFKPAGNARNHNVVRLLDGTYFGFEPDFFDSPKNYGEVERLLYSCFIDQEGVDKGKEKQHQKYSNILQNNFQNFASMREAYQKKVGFYKFNMEKVKSFIEKE